MSAVKDGNKIIAKYMDVPDVFFDCYEHDSRYPKFDKSLDELVPVWEKLEVDEIEFSKDFFGLYYYLPNTMSRKRFSCYIGKLHTLKEAACIATARAIQELGKK